MLLVVMNFKTTLKKTALLEACNDALISGNITSNRMSFGEVIPKSGEGRQLFSQLLGINFDFYLNASIIKS